MNIEAPSSDHQLEFVLFFSVQPSFDENVSWTVFEEPDGRYFVRQLFWDKMFDAQRFRNPMDGLKYGWHTSPTMREQTYHMESRELELLLQESCATDIENIMPDTGGISLDGKRWYFQARSCFGQELLEWYAVSDDLPIVKWAQRFQRLLNDAS